MKSSVSAIRLDSTGLSRERKARPPPDAYLEVQMKDPAFAERFRQAGEAWDVAVQLAALRKKAGLS
ncbi:MAG: hypothetical protein HY000_38155, partial [Planctomycetes bacterium]|nr:hypothetical protein [Planctomycetota bacterium]